MKSRRRALQFFLNATVIVGIKLLNQFGFEMFQGIKFLEIKKCTFQQAKEVFHHNGVKTVAFSAHALPNADVFQQFLVMLVLILPALIGVRDWRSILGY